MDYLKVITASVDFIEDHLAQKISPNTVSRAVFCSTPHLYRIFRYMTGYSIKEYIRKRRLSEAAEALMHGKKKVIDLALHWQYESPECFSRAFRQAYGIAPQYFRGSINEVQLFEPLRPHITSTPSPVGVEYISRKETAVTGPWVRTSMAYGKNAADIPAFWETIRTEGSQLAAPGSDFYGVYTDWFGEDAFTLLAGAEKTGGTGRCGGSDPSPLLITRIIPANRYAAFTVPGADPLALVNTWKYIYGSWFPQTQKDRPRGLVDFEHYSPRSGIRICIPLKD